MRKEGVDAEERINKVSTIATCKDILARVIRVKLTLEQRNYRTQKISSDLNVVHIGGRQIRINCESDQVVVVLRTRSWGEEVLEARVIR